MVCAQDGGDFDGGSYGGFDGGEGGDGGGFGGGYGGGFGGGDDGFVGGEGGYDDGAYDGTAMQPMYAAPETITGPAVVLQRKRRSLADGPTVVVADSSAHRRVRRGGYGVVGPVHTYVRTDYDGNFKWGARHHVGKSYGGGHGGGYGHY
ncbi:hypothetical protein HPB49_011081 [Dermacentor silvarum]|uniref:Uncharacterized protein n=1 Tax=Dermacentor silvarum TaxID=543639 RepID=A0ACB8C8U7_DERSI|nr:ATP-dependent RNA helicase A [Dermacentor silvarum]KAH7937363.1 hypothetical protein HPB49_011081 [Dermacentor silvarum]